MKEFYPNGAKASPEYDRIVNQRQWERLRDMVVNSCGEVLIGGAMDENERFIEPTVMRVSDVNDSLIINESFGPIITIFPVRDLDDAIHLANEIHDTPLAVFPFGTKTEIDRILSEVRSGGGSINDGWIHGTVPTLSFGGVGDSGSGAYRGRPSFDCLTHKRSITSTPGWAEALFAIRYPPYRGKLQRYPEMTGLRPNFDREGRVESGLVGFARALGEGSVRTAALVKYAVSVFERYVLAHVYLSQQ